MEKQIDVKNNCLNLIRIIAALQVFYIHAIAHLRVNMPDTIGLIFGYFQGVPVFFIVSGFLIWISVERSKDYLSFVTKRIIRIYPELWGAVIVEAVAIVLFVGISNIKAFALFVVAQATVFQFWTPEYLRQYGCGTPNGALWTISVIIQFYFVVWIIHKVLHKRSVLAWGGAFLITLLMGAVPVLLSNNVPIMVVKLYGQTIFNYLYLFLAGAFLAEYKAKLLNLLKRYWYILTFVGVLLYWSKFDLPFMTYPTLKSIIGCYGLIGFAYAFPQCEIKKDISYGIYVYQMTVINVMIELGLVGQIKYMIIALVVCVALSVVSTYTVGQWSQKKRQSFNAYEMRGTK